MKFLDPKAQTLKIPRKGINKFNQQQTLDILLACSHFGGSPVSDQERRNFEEYVMSSPRGKISQKMKDALAALSQEDRERLFQ